MKILLLADEESSYLWDHYRPGMLRDYDLIISAGDLKPDYLSFLVTMASCPLLYVHGNHDGRYSRRPPEGCDCVDGRLVKVAGLRILGLGGSRQYSGGAHQYTERQMRRRIMKLRFQLWRHRGVDIVVSHAPIRGMGDGEDMVHQGFEAFLPLLEKYRPRYWVHGHVHQRYGRDFRRVIQHGDTTIINASGKYEIEI